MRRKNGSSMLTVLMISMVVVVVVAVVVSAINFTGSGNANEKLNQDLLYAAESGIDSALSKIRTSEQSGIALSSRLITINDFNSNYGIDVKVDIKKVGDSSSYSYELESIASKERKKRVIKAKVSKSGNYSGIFNNLLCGSGVEVESGSLNLSTGNINIIESSPTLSGGSITGPDEVTNEGFNIPTYKFEKMDIDPVTKKSIFRTSRNNFKEDLKRLADNKKGVRAIEFITDKNSSDYTIYLVNADNFEIEVDTLDLKNVIIIASGNVTMHKVSTINIRYSSIIADKIKFTGVGSANLAYAPYVPEDSPFYPFAPLNAKDIAFINKEISKYSNNWSVDTSDSSYEWSIIEYDYK